ncbi:hypothetical protein [Campylobacter sp. US33a]|uniref:hypothetical protein n=1 Tax=Campylobacter sp. US33a TaxID=2498120 RepID=UPI0010674A45|nr:hypothetical protein [Campylobacter sp. US33a]TEY02763.1 hypothetical protein ELQ16_05155 [Campylobacter sp. US33a]
MRVCKLIQATINVKEDDGISTYKDVRDKVWEDYLNGKIDLDVFCRTGAAFLTASLIEDYQESGSLDNIFGKMKRVQQERLKADTPSEIAVEINKDIFALNNNFNAVLPGMTKEENQRLNNKAKDFLFEILQDIKV